MRTYCILSILLLILGSQVFAYDVLVSPTTSCRTRSDDTTYGSVTVPIGDGNNHDSSKLTVRNEGRGEKSWIRFNDLENYDLGALRSAQLRLTLQSDEDNVDHFFNVSFVNDDCHDNDVWVDHPNLDDQPNGIYALTWNNAPGNDIASYSDLNAAKTTYIGQVDFHGSDVPGTQYYIDVLAALQADTDGIVQFVLHYSDTDLCLCTHDHSGGPAYYPALILEFPPLGADWPNPEDGFDKVPTDLAGLSWTNPEPNLAAYPISSCDVYFGTEPNRPEMDMVVLDEGDLESVPLTAGNFPNYVPLANNTWYYWAVDCHDPIKGVVEGEMWSFYTNNNEPPYDVSAGADQVTWLDPNALVTLSGTASDDGLPDPPGALTYLWERTAGPTSAVIDTPSALSTSVNFTEAGDYTFQLTVSDSQEEMTDTVRVVIGTTPCDASHVFTGALYNDGDINQDCMVDLADLQELIIDDWLNCTDELTNCL